MKNAASKKTIILYVKRKQGKIRRCYNLKTNIMNTKDARNNECCTKTQAKKEV